MGKKSPNGELDPKNILYFFVHELLFPNRQTTYISQLILAIKQMFWILSIWNHKCILENQNAKIHFFSYDRWSKQLLIQKNCLHLNRFFWLRFWKEKYFWKMKSKMYLLKVVLFIHFSLTLFSVTKKLRFFFFVFRMYWSRWNCIWFF